MTFVEPFETIQQAILAELSDEGITAYDHFPIELYPIPSAYLMASDILPDYARSDQGEVAIGRVDYSLRYFVPFDGDPLVAHRLVLEGARKVFRAVASATLANRVQGVSVDRVSIDPVQNASNDRPMLLLEVVLQVRPGHYA